MSDDLYGQNFYSGQIVGSLQSAQIYLYHLFSIWGVPDSVVDVGCGRGAWLATCRDLGVKRVVGIDGYWNSQQAMIDQQIDFYPANLEQKFPITDSFDLAISLEVAEHLQPESSDNFIESLSSLSETVLFGAAFTGQPGVNHINTRPHSFWAGKFFERGYVLFDIFRPVFWSDDRVEPCYRQNTFLYVKPGQQLYRVLIDKGYLSDRNARLIDCIHPAVYLGLLDEYLKIQQPANSAPPLIPPDHINVPPVRESIISDEQTEIDSLIKLAESQLAANEPDKAADSYRQALAQRPNNPECLLRLAHVLLRMKCFEESFHYARQFLRMASDVPIGHYLAGHAARELGRWQESRTFMRRAVELDPFNVYARVLSCMSVFTLCMNEAEAHAALLSYADELDALICSTALDSAEQIDNAAEGIGALTPFFLPYLGTDVKSLQVKYGSWICSVMAAKYPHFTLPLPQLTSDGRIKIAIVSNYFHNHSNWKIPIKGWLEQLDRRLFSIHCFHTGEVTDTDTESARSLADSFLQSSDIEIVATTIREQQFDVLIYPGIGMDPATLKLAALRLAPVQCASWGHPVTTGMPTIDYYISSDLMEPPDGDSHYSEKLLRLPNLSIWYDQAATEDVDFSKLEIPALKKSDFLFLCCQNLLKYLPQYDLVFPTIAASVENARFVFIASPVSELTERFIKRLDLVFKRHGLNTADYVSMLPQLDGAEFAALNARADVFLDSIEWSGCNTVFESLPFNKPIVTLPGTFMRGRHAYAVLKMMGVDETVAGNVEEYVSIAIRLAKEAQWRNDIAAKMSSRKHLVYQDMECIAGLEQFLTAVSGRVKP